MDDTKKLIAENLKRVCTLKGIRQKDIADRIGVSTATVSMWFAATSGIDLSRFVQICEFLGVSIDQMCGKVPLDSALTDDEQYLIDIYRVLDEAEQGNLTTYAEFLQDRHSASSGEGPPELNASG